MNTDAILVWNNIALNAVANDHTGAAQSINVAQLALLAP